PPFPPHPPYNEGPPFPPHPPFPLDPKTFEELKLFFILSILENKPEGISAYKFHKVYKFPRTSVSRLMKKLIKSEYVSSKSSNVDGRERILYFITESGKKYLESLKENWAYRFINLMDLAPPDKYADPFIQRRIFKQLMDYIENMDDKEDIIDYFRGMRSHIKYEAHKLEKLLDNFKKTIEEFDNLISILNSQDQLNKEKIKQELEEIRERLQKLRSNKNSEE
ncbi:MAG: hypothetical protein ACTSU2_02465, partial [Promethearchaeota archaeon]